MTIVSLCQVFYNILHQLKTPTLDMAEKTLEGCECSSETCRNCPNIESTLDSLMLIRAYEEQEISALDDAYDADIDYHMSIA